MGWDSKISGQLLLGWDLTSDTFQLWQSLSAGEESMAEFVGFVVGKIK